MASELPVSFANKKGGGIRKEAFLPGKSHARQISALTSSGVRGSLSKERRGRRLAQTVPQQASSAASPCEISLEEGVLGAASGGTGEGRV